MNSTLLPTHFVLLRSLSGNQTGCSCVSDISSTEQLCVRIARGLRNNDLKMD